ncbi:MAG: hypothetical protein ABL955_15080, partial [Elusimicrobiota bacterium]
MALRARRLRLSGAGDQAETTYREALAASPGHPAASAGLWEILSERGRARMALIDAAVEAEPRRA